MSRRLARETAMKLIFQMAFNYDFSFQSNHEYFLEAQEQLNENNYNYLEQIVALTVEHLDQLDKYIDLYSKNWNLNRLSKVDLSILRLATCEILYMEDIPVSVSINEAVELAKKYSADNANSYINGILDQISHHN